MGVVIRRWLWLECIGVVSGCCCKEDIDFLMITYPYSTCTYSRKFWIGANFRIFRMMPRRTKIKCTKTFTFDILITSNFERAISHVEMLR